jgi:hypothetical protein
VKSAREEKRNGGGRNDGLGSGLDPFYNGGGNEGARNGSLTCALICGSTVRFIPTVK